MDLMTGSGKIMASMHFLCKMELRLITNSYATIAELYDRDINIEDARHPSLFPNLNPPETI